jgi:hypothetical protein
MNQATGRIDQDGFLKNQLIGYICSISLAIEDLSIVFTPLNFADFSRAQ